jgi:hypothetical protein
MALVRSSRPVLRRARFNKASSGRAVGTRRSSAKRSTGTPAITDAAGAAKVMPNSISRTTQKLFDTAFYDRSRRLTFFSVAMNQPMKSYILGTPTGTNTPPVETTNRQKTRSETNLENQNALATTQAFIVRGVSLKPFYDTLTQNGDVPVADGAVVTPFDVLTILGKARLEIVNEGILLLQEPCHEIPTGVDIYSGGAEIVSRGIPSPKNFLSLGKNAITIRGGVNFNVNVEFDDNITDEERGLLEGLKLCVSLHGDWLQR